MRKYAIYRRLLLVIALVSAIVIPVTASSASAAQQEHCLIATNGVDKEGNYIIESTTCYDKFYKVLLAAGASGVPKSVTPATAGPFLLSTWIIGTHFDGLNGGGSSFTVEGSDCAGGGLPVPIGWNDRISSTTNGCGLISHYENTNYTGNYEWTTGPGNHNLTSMNNKTSSLKYFTWP